MASEEIIKNNYRTSSVNVIVEKKNVSGQGQSLKCQVICVCIFRNAISLYIVCMFAKRVTLVSTYIRLK